jgi:peptidoglycan/LPS O-acetylase OafA/YrhL
MDKNLVYLDRLRALAVLGVLVVHTSQFSFGNLAVTTSAELAIFTILSAGRFGVEVFFLLSGFLLSYLYESSGKEKSNKQYFFARLLRIWPLWILFTFVWASIYAVSLRNGILEEVDSEWILTGILLSAFFLLWISPTHYDAFIGGAWSIQIEVFSYLIFAFLRYRPLSTILLVAIFINIAGLGLAFSGELEGSSALSALRRQSLQTGFNFFVLGWLLARVYTHQKNLVENHKLGSQSLWESFRQVFSGTELLLGLWLTSFLLTPAIYGNPIEAVGFVALAAVVAQISGASKFVSFILQRTGKLSYFIFFMHFVILHFAGLLMPVGDRPSALGAVLVFNLVSIVVVYLGCVLPAAVSLRYFERPILSIAKRK